MAGVDGDVVDLHAVRHSRRDHRRRAGQARSHRDEPCRDAALGIHHDRPGPGRHRPRPPRSGWVIRATASGRRAQRVWLPLTGVIEQRWAERFGADNMAALAESLQAVAERLDPALPDCLPILGYGLWSTPDGERPRDLARPSDHARPATEPGQRTEPRQPRADLPTLLSRVLLAFA